MKKIDKLVLDAFLGPFFITFLVVVFILLNINMLKYFDDIVGKDLGWGVVGQLFFYFAVFTIPTAMPLAVLLSSLIAFGNLGEHFELTAIKSAGVSLVRVLRPIMFFVVILTVMAFLANNYLVPKAALEAYSLLYDIKQKKPALELQEGAFYDGIPGISIKVNKKYPDGNTFNDVVIYDHRKNDGNKEVIVADSGKMYTILNEQYLKLELFNGYNYAEGAGKEREMTGQRAGAGGKESITRSKFDKTQAVFDLSSFNMGQTDKKWFQGNRIMRNLSELDTDMDSIRREILKQRLSHYQYRRTFFNFYGRKDSLKLPPEVLAYQTNRDSFYIKKYNTAPREVNAATEGKIVVKDQPDSALKPADTLKTEKPVSTPLKEKPKERSGAFTKRRTNIADVKKDTKRKDKIKPKTVEPVFTVIPAPPKVLTIAQLDAKIDSLLAKKVDRANVQGAMNMARQNKSQTQNITGQIDNFGVELRTYAIQWHYIIASSLACIVMFLIGAPLGAIIKKGGLGMPFLVSILFFIIYYVLTMQGQKLAKQGTFNVAVCIYAADFLLFIVGLFFLRQARIDARLFESDSYAVAFDKFKKWRESRKKPVVTTAV